MMAPISVLSSSGSPIFRVCGLAASLSRKESKISRCRNSREPAVQDWLCRVNRIAGDDAVDHPVLVGVGEHDRRALAAELERHRHDPFGGRRHDELADLGRSGERELADAGMVGERRAALLAESGERRSARRAGDAPGRSRPAGARPAAHPRRPSSPSCCRRTGPARSSAAASSTGAFHGMMRAHDAEAAPAACSSARPRPAGSSRPSARRPGRRSSGRCPPRAALRGRACVRIALPVSVAIVRAISSVRPSSASAIRRRARPRSRGATLRHRGNAAVAACTARSTSRAVPRGTSAMGSRRAGFSTVMTSPSTLSTHSLPMSMRWRRSPDAGPAVPAVDVAIAMVFVSVRLR